MIKEYFKIAWKLQVRKKLYLLVSLAGISFTLTILIVAASFYNFLLRPNYPEYKKDRTLFVSNIVLYGINASGTSMRYGNPSFNFLEKYICKLQTPENVGIASQLYTNIFFKKNEKFDLRFRYVNDHFWDIFDFELISGEFFSKEEYLQNDFVAIVSLSTAKKQFGSADEALGKQIRLDNTLFRIKGIVTDVSANQNSFSDIWLPIRTFKQELDNKHLIGGCRAFILAKSSSDFDLIKTEFSKRIKAVQFPEPNSQDQISVELLSSMELFLREKFGVTKNLDATGYSETTEISESKFFTVLFLLAIFLLAFSALNLVNIGASRMKERTSEMGVRKSFGASKKTLLKQIIFEQVILVGEGGILAFLFSYLILEGVEFSQVITGSKFFINGWVVSLGILFVLFFSFISGVIPALKMARINIVESLKGGEL